MEHWRWQHIRDDRKRIDLAEFNCTMETRLEAARFWSCSAIRQCGVEVRIPNKRFGTHHHEWYCAVERPWIDRNRYGAIGSGMGESDYGSDR
jgi:hypothetical protein